MKEKYGGQSAPYRVTNGVPHRGTSTDYALNALINYPASRRAANEQQIGTHDDASWRVNRRARMERTQDGTSNTLFVGGKHVRRDQISGPFANRTGNYDECIYLGGWGGTARSYPQSLHDNDRPEADGPPCPASPTRGGGAARSRPATCGSTWTATSGRSAT